MKKCDSYCDAKNNLWLRNGTFYFIIETPRVNGKRRYKRTSLHTTNYFEAREKVKDMLVMTMPTSFFTDLERLYKGLIFESESGQTLNIENPFATPARLSKKNKVEDIHQKKNNEPCLKFERCQKLIKSPEISQFSRKARNSITYKNKNTILFSQKIR
ncbi:MAG: hypothetical protein LBB23_00390 [Rickettsiales bacterium]|jgi:hypothetical protein|nr:hypothetical protein [Rickettsiales bacterium]